VPGAGSSSTAISRTIRDHNLAVLGVALQTQEDTAASAAKWEGKALEDAFMMSGGCGAFARATEEWAQHPQAAAASAALVVRAYGGRSLIERSRKRCADRLRNFLGKVRQAVQHWRYQTKLSLSSMSVDRRAAFW
jgi:hypothetical protein